jgi:molybdopterin converting factor small subunit
MPLVSFTPQLRRFLDCPPRSVPASTLREALDAVFAQNPRLRGYLLDDRGRLREHVTVFINGRRMDDRGALDAALDEGDSVFVMQALSGG